MERQSFVRISKIDQQLRSRPYTSVQKLLDETEASRRTIFRDINALLQMGAPVSFSKKYNGYFYLAKHNWRLPEIALTEGDLLAVLLAEQAIAAVDSGYLGRKLRPCLAKLRLLFQRKIKIAPDEVFSFGKMPQPVLTAETAATIELVLKAIEQKKKIICAYQASGRRRPARLIIEPYHLHFRGKWYLFGWSEYSKDFRTYAVPRMSGAQMTAESFAPRDFDRERYLGRAWGLIKGRKTQVLLEFAESQAVFLREKIWHPSQKLGRPKNGKIRLSLSVDGLEEIFWWILSYGSLVKVIKPGELVRQIKKELNASLRQYK
jgi:proteasome accessory factor B